MYVFMYTYMYVSMYQCMYICMYAPNLVTKSLKNTFEKIHILESCFVSLNKIFDIHL